MESADSSITIIHLYLYSTLIFVHLHLIIWQMLLSLQMRRAIEAI